MTKIKYFYNTHTLRYEKLEVPLRVKLLRIFGFLASAFVTAFIIVSIAYKYFPSTNEKRLMQQNGNLKDDYTILQDRVKQLELQMDELENRDNNVYRSIFEATPIPDSARVTEMEKTKEVKLIEKLSENDLIKSMNSQLNNLSLRTAFMEKSYVEIGNMVKNKEK